MSKDSKNTSNIDEVIAAENDLTTEQKLNMETASLTWRELELFFAKGNLIRVDQNKDLVKVAALIADNKHQEIEVLIANQEIEFMTADWVKNNCEADSSFWTVVVAPYVICQPEN